MCIHILLCTAGRILLAYLPSSIVISLLIASTPTKLTPFSLGKRKKKSHDASQVNMEDVPLGQDCWMFSTSSPINFQTCPDLWWKSSKYSSFSCPADFWSFKQSTNDCHTPPGLPARRWPQSCLLKASHFFCLVILKNTCAWHSIISMHVLKCFKHFWRSYAQPNISGLFIPRCS